MILFGIRVIFQGKQSLDTVFTILKIVFSWYEIRVLLEW